MTMTRGCHFSALCGVFAAAGMLALGACPRSAGAGERGGLSAVVGAVGLSVRDRSASFLVAPAAVQSSTASSVGSTQKLVGAGQSEADVASDLPPDTPEAIAAMPRLSVEGLLIPVVGVKPSELVDTFTQARSSGRVHDAIDIMAAHGTPVVAASDGHVVKLFNSKRGGLTVYQFDPQDKVIYYYAHLDGYSPALAEGQLLHRGDPIGFVGSTGDASADAPHLHFEIEMMGPKKQWWHGTSINPYGRFAGQRSQAVGSTKVE